MNPNPTRADLALRAYYLAVARHAPPARIKSTYAKWQALNTAAMLTPERGKLNMTPNAFSGIPRRKPEDWQ